MMGSYKNMCVCVDVSARVDVHILILWTGDGVFHLSIFHLCVGVDQRYCCLLHQCVTEKQPSLTKRALSKRIADTSD